MPQHPGEAMRLGAPILAKGLLRPLFQPNADLRPGTGASRGNTLFHTLAGSVFADRALAGHVSLEAGGVRRIGWRGIRPTRRWRRRRRAEATGL